MNAEFKKIKKRCLAEAVIKSVICGVALGLFAVGAVLLGLKLAETEINAGFYVLIGVVPALLAGGAVFFFLRPTDEKTAKFLDREYGLNEKVQTMVAFSGRDEDIYNLQRADAGEKLAALPKYRPDIKKLWHYIVIFVLALALFITAVAIPVKAPPAEPVIPFTYTERQRAAVEQLISDVEETSLTEEEKSSVKSTLEAMSASLENAYTQSEMKAFVFSAVALIDLLLYTPNSFDNVAYVLGGERTEFLAGAFTDGVLFFKASAVTVTTLDQVKALESDMLNSVGGKVDLDMDVFVQQYGAELSGDILSTVKEINEIMKNVSNDTVAPEDDAVRLSVESFLEDMLEIEENYESFSYDGLQSAVKANINAFKDELVPALIPQSGKCLADEFIRRRVAQIFDIDSNELPRQNSGVQELDELPEDKDPDEGTHGGGIGRDDAVYGSSEYIYDPDTGELTVYGAVFNQYYASMTEQLFNGSIPENLQESIKKYFDVLYSGTLPKDNENNEE